MSHLRCRMESDSTRISWWVASKMAVACIVVDIYVVPYKKEMSLPEFVVTIKNKVT